MSRSLTDDSSDIEYSDVFLESLQEEETQSCKGYSQKGGWLTKEEEKEIAKQVDDQFKHDFKKLKIETKEKQVSLRKKFKSIIDNSRSLLIAARLNAEKVTVNKLEETALKKQEEIERRRALRSKKVLVTNSNDKELHYVGGSAEWVKEHIDEMAALRKIQSDLDRARARKKANSAISIVGKAGGNGKIKLSNMLNTEVRRLEKAEEVHKLVVELTTLDLKEEASQLMQSLKSKESSELELRAKLYNENLKARLKATRKKELEIARLRKERIANKERLERERKEREERERRERVMAALKRKAQNMELQKRYDQSVMSTRLSRSFTYSYFPK